MLPVVRATVLAPAIILAGAVVAMGHAFLDRAEPSVGSTVRTPPAEVRLVFTEALESAFSRAEVRDSGGQRVDTGIFQIDPKNRKLLRVPLKQGLAPGAYKVIWRVLSVDTHVTEGDFMFRVSP
jgi:methionine-rich copper-binding protein CopC